MHWLYPSVPYEEGGARDPNEILYTLTPNHEETIVHKLHAAGHPIYAYPLCVPKPDEKTPPDMLGVAMSYEEFAKAVEPYTPEKVEELLQAGAVKARAVATPFAAKLRHAVGLRPLQAAAEAKVKTDKAALPSFKQYREKDGQFYFKLADAKGRLLLQSLGYSSPKQCGEAIAQLKAQGWSASPALHGMAAVAADASAADADAALQVLRDAA